MKKNTLILLLLIVCVHTGFGQITRTQIISNAIPYTNYSWTASACNLWSGSSCGGRNVYKAPWVTVGTNIGMPYNWGGWSTIAQHNTAMTNCKSAGEVCSSGGGGCSGLPGAGLGCGSGQDCSGLISRAWALSTKYGTSNLPSISIAYSSLSQLQKGDIVNKAGSHVRLVETNYGNGNYRFIEASGTDWKVAYHSYTASQLSSYSPRRYNNVTAAAPPANDNCVNAQVLSSNSTCISTLGNVAGATASSLAKASCDAFAGTPQLFDVWYRFQATNTSHTVIVAPSGSFDAVVSLYTSCTGGQIGCADNGGGNGSSETINATGLVVGTAYYIRVYSYGASSPATTSFNICVTAPSPPSCGIPSGLTSGSVDSTGATLSWSPVAGATSYNVQYKAASSSIWTTVSSTTTSRSITGLTPATAYQFQVQAVCSSAGASSAAATFTTTAPSLPCGTPSGLSANSITSTSATLNWTAVSGATSYIVEYSLLSSSIWTTITSTTASKSITGLAAATAYQFRVKAVCSNTGVFSSTAPFSTQATTSTTSTISIGTGTSPYSAHPFGTIYMDERTQYIITKSELTSAGWSSAAPNLKSIAFNVTNAAAQPMGSFSISIAHISASTFSTTTFLSGSNNTTVYSGTVAAVSGWNTYNFSTPFAYNGTGNLLISICWNNSSFTANSSVQSFSYSNYVALYYRADLSGSGVCSKSTGTRSYYRPNAKLTFSSSLSMMPQAGENELERGIEDAISSVDIANGSTVEIYPNPFDGTILYGKFVDIDGLASNNAKDKSMTISIYDMLGRKVLAKEITAEEGLFSLSFSDNPLQSGMYIFVGVTNNDRYTKTIVVK